MVQRIINMDWQIVVLNSASVGSIVGAAMAKDSTGWAVGFLIVTVGVLNLAKAYATVKELKDKEDEE
tara:strand:+ start:805 stop:1005 length:201 start_codon:yes stop_codon:yes gene_type:complete